MRDELTRPDNSPVPPGEWGPGYDLWQAFQNMLGQRGPDGANSLVRMGSHLAVIMVAVLVLWLSRVQLPNVSIVAEAEPPVVTVDVTEAEIEPVAEVDENVEIDEGGLVRMALPNTIIPERARIEIITHTVTAGDTLYGIAKTYKLSAETLVWANNSLQANPDLLRIGQTLTILPLDGIYHTVAKGETIAKIAGIYKVKPESIINYALNRLDANNPSVAVGQRVIVPGAHKDLPVHTVQVYRGTAPAGVRKGTGQIVWPTSGRITQAYKPLHRAIDIARSTGTPVKSADNGYVVVAGWSNLGYGNYVVIDHGNGYQTLYAHLSRIHVAAGNVVTKGAQIGLMGSTGRSTGPHLHFEVRRNGVQVNPMAVLP